MRPAERLSAGNPLPRFTPIRCCVAHAVKCCKMLALSCLPKFSSLSAPWHCPSWPSRLRPPASPSTLTGPQVNRQLFGQFAEHLGAGIYGGIWVGEDSKIPNMRGYRNDVLQALRDLKVPVVRWPGGCFADEYNWREGVGPRSKRPVKINTHWGGVTEPNTFGTHEFMDFAEVIGAEAYISGNVGSASPREL